MEKRKTIIEILQAVRHSSSNIEKQADRICALFRFGLSDEELFNNGFNEGYTSPLEIDGIRITQEQYEEGRKENYKEWLKEVESKA